jgi:hypothetical protein
VAAYKITEASPLLAWAAPHDPAAPSIAIIAT